MPANVGRLLKIKQGSTTIAGVRSKTITANGEPIDITTDDENGYRTLLSDPATRSLDISVEGLTKDNTLRSAILTGSSALLLTDINIEFPNGDTITGDFFFNSHEETGNHTDAVGFTASFQSSGEWTFTAA